MNSGCKWTHIITRALRERRSPWPRELSTLILLGFPIWRVNMKISKFTHNLLTNCWISDWAVSMVIWFATRILSPVPFTTLDSSIKCHHNPLITFWVMLLTDKQTERQINKQLLVNRYRNITSFTKDVTKCQTWHSLNQMTMIHESDSPS